MKAEADSAMAAPPIPPPDTDPAAQLAAEKRYPPYVAPEQRERWDLAEACARRALGEDAPTGAVWMGTRAIYGSSIPTY